jgi:hypothetical protein
MKLFFAAPASGFPFLLTALLSHVPDVPCGAAGPIAVPIATALMMTASMSRFILILPVCVGVTQAVWVCWTNE